MKRESGPASAIQKVAISYLCRLHPKQGTLLLEKCVEEGVPAGPLYGQLKAGKDVTLECGKVVRAENVCSPNDPGPIFLVIDCPDESYLENLINNPKINQFRTSAEGNELDTPEVIVHFTPNEVTYLYTLHLYLKYLRINQKFKETFQMKEIDTNKLVDSQNYVILDFSHL